jgi:hypothetical protein
MARFGRVYKNRVNLRCCTILNKLFMNRQDACSTRKFTLCGTGILPVLENGARCELKTTKLAPTQQYDISVGDIVVLNIGMTTLQANPILPDIANESCCLAH